MEAKQVIHRIKIGDDRVFTELYRSYRDEFVIWICRQQKLNEEDACDVFQNTIVIFYQNVKSGKVEHLTSSVKTYLFGIGRNKAREWKRKKPNNIEEPSFILMNSLVEDSDIEEKEQLEQQIMMIYQSLRKLGDPCKALLELFYYQRLSMDEIATLNGYSGSASVKTQKYKCLARLRKIYKSEYQKTG